MLGLCRKVGMSRQNYYRKRRCRQRRAVEEELVVELVKQERKVQPGLGGRKLKHRFKEEMEQAGVQMGRDRFFDLLRRHGLLLQRKRAGKGTTQSRHGYRVYGNELKKLQREGAHQAWVSDLTYLATEEGFVYLSLVQDWCSRKAVGWACHDGLEAQGCLRALRQLPADKRPLHHSDRGIQYCCRAYVQTLEKRGMRISMTEENHCYENAQAEQLIGILKQEYGLGEKFRTKAQAREAVQEAIWLYNTRRPHQSLKYETPEAVHSRAA